MHNKRTRTEEEVAENIRRINEITTASFKQAEKAFRELGKALRALEVMEKCIRKESEIK